MTEIREPLAFAAARLQDLFEELQKAGYRVAGPYLQNGAIGFGFPKSFAELPVGFEDAQAPGHYRLQAGQDPTFFRYAVGPHSIKTVLHPARRKLWEAHRTAEQSPSFLPAPLPDTAIALFGVRACDVKALDVLDRVFLEAGYREPHYAALRDRLFIVAVACAEPSALCFCSSMGYGPVPEHFDIQLTEVYSETQHDFVAEAGTERGWKILEALQANPAEEQLQEAVVQQQRAAVQKIRKFLNTRDLPRILQERPQHARWDEVAERCLSCGNCTMVCPTCFCTTTEDITDLSGDHTERWLQWDSCYTADFSFIHGGSVRKTTRARYRQWLTHKLSTWHEQFGTSGCVGCGRCIAFCPVGIDLTEEARAIRGEP